MMDFLLELLSEEIPARMQEKASADLARLFADEIARSGLKPASIESHATPRRLALIARGLPAETAAVSEEIKGPRASAPPQALEGFLRKTGLSRDQLVERDGVLFAVIAKPGRATADVLAQAIPAIVRGFPWPKSMRWGAASASTASLRWVRPLQGIVALLGDDVVPFEIDGIASGVATIGHRFHHPGAITIGNADDYAAKLRACHVIVDAEERKAIIRTRAAALAAEAGYSVIPDEGLVAENAGLTEWPVPLLGRFDPDFLTVPREVIQLTLRTNQKYFVLNDAAGKLAPAFICTANIDASDGGAAIVAGNGKVLAARLSDARFFWEQDLKIPLEEQAKKLDQIVFHEKLGTVADKVDRVVWLARWLVETNVVKLADAQTFLFNDVSNAARFAKADLVTGMVGEFPELQGVMGGYYARAQGLSDAAADAIRDHYKPAGQGDEVPTAPVTVAVSLADKLDSLCEFYSINEKPTGSKDPYALRRAALGIIQILIDNDISLPLLDLIVVVSRRHNFGTYDQVMLFEDGLRSEFSRGPSSERSAYDSLLLRGNGFALLDFLADRLKVQQREAGVRHDLIDAVFALGGEDDLVRLLARVKALQAFVATEDGTNLLAGYKRAANILKKEGWGDFNRHPELVSGSTHQQSPSVQDEKWMLKQVQHDGAGTTPLSYTSEPAEAALIEALDIAAPQAASAIAAEDFESAMAALAALRGPIDAFFEGVTVNDADPAKRAARLALLDRIRAAVHQVADFSRIEG